MKSFWQQTLANAAAGLIIAAAGGVGYLCWSVPRQLDQLLQNQRVMGDKFGIIENRLGKAEEKIETIDTRVTRIESR